MSIQCPGRNRKQVLTHVRGGLCSERQAVADVNVYVFCSYRDDLRVSKGADDRSFVGLQTDSAFVPPNSSTLAGSIEKFPIPREVLTICVGKSTYVRCGFTANVTPFEPE